MLKISNVEKGSVAKVVGLQKDDEIVRFNGEQAKDMLDVAYFDSQANFSVTVNRSGEEVSFHV